MFSFSRGYTTLGRTAFTTSAKGTTSVGSTSSKNAYIPLLPKEVVSELDRHIVGQKEAKKAVAIALRNRWRRLQLEEDLRKEVSPKNILMIGPTGVGKTEIARRMAKLSNAPFIKVEATKFTEVGFHGKDVDNIIKDLVTIAIADRKRAVKTEVKEDIEKLVNEKLLNALVGESADAETRQKYLDMLREGTLGDQIISVDVKPDNADPSVTVANIFNNGNLNTHPFRFVVHQAPKQEINTPEKNESMTVDEARAYFTKELEGERSESESIVSRALRDVAENGIVFIDEIDKVCRNKEHERYSADASAEGVQRDLLPLIEGSVISTKHGDVDTSKILFICSGAFYNCKPSDLLPELQGRLPVRVSLDGLTESDMYKILTEPQHNLIKQQVELLKTDGVNIEFPEETIKEIARVADKANKTIENIGARRLHTIVEKIVEDYSYNCDQYTDAPVVIDVAKVQEAVNPMLKHHDLRKYLI